MANFKVKNGLDIGNATYVGTISPSAITAARTYTLPNVSGTFVTTGDTGSITNTMILDGTIADAKLATITTAGKVANSATTAVSTNTANAIVTRDAGGGFSAGVISGVSFNSITALSSTNPLMNSAAAVGTSTTVARADHIHPIDTTRAPLASPVFTGNVTGLGVATGTSFNSITGLANIAPLMDGTAAVGTSTLAARQDHRHLSDTTKANISQMMYIGTTSVPINRGSGAITLAGTSIDGNSGTATTLIGDETNWAAYRSRSVANMLGWKNYGNNHVIFDASNGTAPNGAAINNTNSASAWGASHPTLMGWNGGSTYGVRVDSARVSDSCSGNAATATRAYPRRADGGDLNFYWSGQGGQPSWLWGGGDGTNMFVYNPSNFSVNYANSAGTVNSLGNYACKAWGNINGTGAASIRASGNLSSVSDLGVGYYGINFASAMPDAKYAALVTVGPFANGADHSLLGDMNTTNVTYTNTGFRVNVMSSGAGQDDRLYVNIAVFR